MIRICKKINGNVKFACHCGERSDETIHGIEAAMDCHGAKHRRLAMTGKGKCLEVINEASLRGTK